jgi:catecholate siderophore receptor
MLTSPRTSLMPRACPKPQGPAVLDLMVGLASALPFASAAAQTAPAAHPDGSPADVPGSETITVKGQRTSTELAKLPAQAQNTPASISVLTKQLLAQQNATTLQEALRYAPGITLNSGEGGAHGDNVNLRGFSGIDDFFLDGLRDPGSYMRDNFNTEAIEVLEGPSSILFGNGSAAGIVNQTSKLPVLAPLRAAGLVLGTNDEARGTIDVNQPLTDTAAIRLNALDETAGVAGRDYVYQDRWGVAPSLSLGIGQPTTFTLVYDHQHEHDLPDYGIPFLNGVPAPVPRSLYYGLKNADTTVTDTDIASAVLHHDFEDGWTVTETLRYADYFSNYRLSAPHFGSDYIDPQPQGTPLDQIVVFRDRPSSEARQTYLTDHVDVTGNFQTFSLPNLLLAGVEYGRLTNDGKRYDNDYEGIDGVAPTPLLAPDANESFPVQNTVVSRPRIASDLLGIYAIDTIQIVPKLSLTFGLRYDSYDTSFADALSDTGFHHIDSAWSPKAAAVFKPTPDQTYYFSFGTSFDPPASYLTLAPSDTTPKPAKSTSFEAGAKFNVLGGKLHTTLAIFRTDSSNIVVSDPDDPTLQEVPGSNQRINGFEVSALGYLTEDWEINANYTFIDPEITASATPGEVGKAIPNAARNTANLWTVYEFDHDRWKIGTGINYVGHRYADIDNIANVPGAAIWNAMLSVKITERLSVQLNVDNILNKYYYLGAYFSDPTESHVIPGPGRTAFLTTNVKF